MAPIRRASAVTQAQGLRIGLLAQFKLSVGRQQLIKVHQVLDEIKLEFGRLVLGIELEGLLKLVALRVELHLDDIELSLGLVVLLAEPINLVLLGIKLNPVPALNVLLNLHSHDISVDRQSHLVGHRVNFPLFLFDSSAHVIKALLNRQLELLLCLNLLRKAFLKLCGLRAHLLIMALEVRIECVDLLLFGDGSL